MECTCRFKGQRCIVHVQYVMIVYSYKENESSNPRTGLLRVFDSKQDRYLIHFLRYLHPNSSALCDHSGGADVAGLSSCSSGFPSGLTPPKNRHSSCVQLAVSATWPSTLPSASSSDLSWRWSDGWNEEAERSAGRGVTKRGSTRASYRS
eukprot:768494-Hanusia_phi.AAC.2